MFEKQKVQDINDRQSLEKLTSTELLLSRLTEEVRNFGVGLKNTYDNINDLKFKVDKNIVETEKLRIEYEELKERMNSYESEKSKVDLHKWFSTVVNSLTFLKNLDWLKDLLNK